MSPPGTAVAEYEAVRREATTGVDTPGLGLTLLRARGLPAWLAAVTALGPPPIPPRLRAARAPVAHPPRLLPASARALTTILAGMVLACTRTPEGLACPTAR